MKRLNKTATKTFLKLIVGIDKLGDHKRLGEPGGALMPLSIEFVDVPDFGPGNPVKPTAKIISLAQWYVQESDIMWDPMMSFLVGDGESVFPMTFEQSSLGTYHECARFEDGKLLFSAKMQADITSFANTWLKNLKDQFQL